jgi:hypothetical protein
MTVEESLKTFGIQVSKNNLDEIRALLIRETALETLGQGDGDTELMKLCAVQLFGAGCLEDVLPIWEAKRASMDAFCALDVQFLCGAGLAETKAFLATSNDPQAASALTYLQECEESGDFRRFSVSKWLGYYVDYFSTIEDEKS